MLRLVSQSCAENRVSAIFNGNVLFKSDITVPVCHRERTPTGKRMFETLYYQSLSLIRT